MSACAAHLLLRTEKELVRVQPVEGLVGSLVVLDRVSTHHTSTSDVTTHINTASSLQHALKCEVHP